MERCQSYFSGLTNEPKYETLSPAVMEQSDSKLSALVEAAEKGDGRAAGKLFDVLYSELHRLARRQLARSGAVSLGATTLLHEAYLDMAEQEGRSFPDRARFMGYAARVMRGLIIDHARSRCAIKRGGQFEITSYDTKQIDSAVDDRELTRVSEALDELAKVDSSLSELVDLKFFCGFSFAEIAAMRGLSERTVQRKWEQARIYLHHSLQSDSHL
jgi:RNA polymerase sigma factor (TIGR02999 family)